MTALYALTEAQHATVLAALRYYQRDMLTLRTSGVYDIATSAGTLEPLTASEIDGLCDNLNCKSLTFGDIVNLLGEDESNPYVAGASEHRLANDLEFDGKVMVSNGDDGGAYVMCWLWVSDSLAGIAPDDEEDESLGAISEIEDEDRPNIADKITDEMLAAAAKIDDIDEAVRSVMDQVGIDEGGVAGIAFSGLEDPWASLSDDERLHWLEGWRDSERVYNEPYPLNEVKP